MKDSSKILLRDRKELKKMYQENGVWHTAKMLSVGLNTVRRWLDEHGIERKGKIAKNSDKSFLKRRRPTSFIVNGYRFIKQPGHREQLEHRLVMERCLKRKLLRSEIVHHVDGDKLNNDISNLILCNNQREHCAIHDSMDEIVTVLVKIGMVEFDRKSKKYKLNL